MGPKAANGCNNCDPGSGTGSGLTRTRSGLTRTCEASWYPWRRRACRPPNYDNAMAALKQRAARFLGWGAGPVWAPGTRREVPCLTLYWQPSHTGNPHSETASPLLDCSNNYLTYYCRSQANHGRFSTPRPCRGLKQILTSDNGGRSRCMHPQFRIQSKAYSYRQSTPIK